MAESELGVLARSVYLTAVYGLVAWWAAEGKEVDRARRALRLGRLRVSEREDAFASIKVVSTADKAVSANWS